ncbi:uncharacterized protein MONBRDRAFT_6317 [Monosiga brevicollis MX1]|uniref:I/LWEQ domain-containing protein n=1 Tax=Monosiga brevicollis TaxID=81824 RepID=A9UTH2_MONBE|nr:uncharacterized protein MONBRDRAFT_6317 [Monosiga brevicollis MX1]EDQ91246.1 predicted protein [Monosiga brevicollis MX1]|eukprot:XP_001743668.1 hypothetical protein [Monosiga brevicollis MX1]
MAAAKSAAPAIEEPAAAAQLTACSRALGACLAELKSGVTEANDACQDLEIESAAFAVSQLSEYLTSVVDRSKTGRLRVSGSNNNNKHGALVNDAAKQLQASMSQLFTGIDQQDESYASACSRSVATAARGFAEHVTRYASTLESPADQQAVLSAAERAVTELASGLAVVRTAVGGDQPARTTLETQDKAFSARLGDVTAYLPGQLDIRRAMSSVQGAKVKLESKAPASAKPDVKKYTAMQHELTVAAEVFNQAAAKMARAPREGSKMALAPASQELATAHERVVQVGMSMMESCARPEDRSELMKKLMAMSNTTSGLLSQVGAAMANKDGQQAQLGSAMRNLTTCLNGLLETCSSAAPGQQECDTAERSLQAVLTGTEEALAPVSSLNYFQCFDEIMDASKELGSSLAALAAGAREQDMAKFGDALDAMTGSTSQLVRASTQAAYLMAVSDPTSTTGEQGLLDPLAVAQAAQAIDEAAVLLMSSSSTKPIASIARTVAASTTTLSNLCKLGATRASNKTLRTQLVDAARTVAQTTSALVQHIKRYAADPSDAHKMAAQEAFASLQDCARHLVTLSEMPEYASAAPQISEGAKRRQQPYLESGRAIAEAAIAVVRTARNLAANAKNTEQWQQLAANSKAVSEAIKRQAAVIKAHSPGQLECDNATYFLNEVTHDLNEAEYAAQQQGLAPIAENSLEGYQQDAITVTDDIGQAARAVAEAAIGSAQHLAQAALRLQNAFNPLVSAAMGVASHLGERSVQTTLLQQAKTIVEAGAELLNAARDSGGNPAASSQHKVVSLAAQNLRKCVKEFVFNLSQRNAEDAVVQGTMSTIQQAIESLAAGSAGTSATAAAASGDYVGQSFVEYQDAITTDTRKLAKHVQQLVGRVGSDPAALVTLVQDIKDCFVTMTEHTSGALVNISSEAVQSHLQKSVTELGGACARVIQAANDVRKSPESGDVKQELALASRECAKQVNSVVAALQAGSQGTQACLTAAAAVETQLADLETMALFATAGSVAAEGTESFREHQPPMLEAARGLVDRAKRLISSAASSQGDLADAAENCQSMYNDLVDKLKLSLDSLASAGPEAQVLLINAARDVGNSLADLLNSTRKASGRSADDPAMQALGHQTKHMANSVTALLRTVQTVENEQGRVTTALKAAQGAIETEASVFCWPIFPCAFGCNMIFARAGRPLTAAVTKLASATNSGNASDLTMAANVARNAMCNLLKQTRRSTAVGVAPATANSVMREAQRCASSLNEIFEVALELEGRPGDATEKERVRNATKEIADALTNLNTAAFSLKGSDDSTAGAQEPSVAAERELLSAASTIDAVTIKLARLEESIPVAAAAIDESAPVEEQVLHGTQAITAATATLVKAATAAQQELGNGGGDENSTAADLVAAAKLVAHATQELCDGANASMRGDLSQERLVAAAKSIAKSTAQLIMACKVKMPSNSGPMRRLQAAGSAVKKAAENLVRTVQAAPTDVEDSIQLDASRVHAMKQEIEAVEAIVKQERELEVAKRALAKIRANKYGKGSTKVDWAGSVRIK